MLIQGISAVGAAIAVVLGALAAVQSRRTESKTATREEIDQALKAQGDLLDRYEARIAMLEARVETAVGKQAVAEDAHRKCQDDLAGYGTRLRLAEARITELGG